MPEGWPTKAGGLTQGLLQGGQLGMLMREQGRKDKEAEGVRALAQIIGGHKTYKEKGIDLSKLTSIDQIMAIENKRIDHEKQEQENILKMIKYNTEMAANPSLSKTDRLNYMNTTIELGNKLQDTKTPPLTEWNPQSEIFAKKASGLIKDVQTRKISYADALSAAPGLYLEATTSEEQKEVENLMKQVRETEEASNLSGALFLKGAIPDVQDTGIQQQIKGNMLGLLKGAGTAGIDVIKKGFAEPTDDEITSNVSDTGYYITKSGKISNIKAGSKPHERNTSTALLSWMKAAEKDALLAVGTKQSIIGKLMQAYDTGDEQAIQSAMLAATGGMSSEQKALYDKKKDWFMRNQTPQDIRKSYINITPETPAAPTISIKEGSTATNPKTGQKIILKGGKWQILK